MAKKIFFGLFSIALILLVLYSFVYIFEPDATVETPTKTYVVGATVYEVGHTEWNELSHIQAMKQASNREEWPVIMQMLEDEDEFIEARKNWHRTVDGQFIEGYDPELDKVWNTALYR